MHDHTSATDEAASRIQFPAEDVIRALYRVAFNRAPDPSGMAAFRDRIEQDPEQLHSLAIDLYASEEHRQHFAVPSLPDHTNDMALTAFQ